MTNVQANSVAESTNSRSVLLSDMRQFEKEIENNYRELFREPVPHRRPAYGLFVWFLELFDHDRQFTRELDEFLIIQAKRLGKRNRHHK